MIAAAVPPRLATLVLPLLGFSVGLAVVLFYPIALGDVAYNYARLSAWAALLLATPAMLRFVRDAGRAPLGEDWRMWWSFALAMYLVHVALGMAMFDGSVATAFTVQSTLVAASNFGLIVAWVLSVAAAWRGTDRLWLHGVATAWLALSMIVATVHVAVGSSPLIGGGIAALLVFAAAARLIAPHSGRPLP